MYANFVMVIFVLTENTTCQMYEAELSSKFMTAYEMLH
jgi:hypothetical protein